MNAMLKNYHAAALPLAALLMFTALPAAAQRTDSVRVEGRRVVIEMGDDGRVYVDGREVGEAGAGGVYAFRLEPDADGDAIVLRAGPPRGRFVVGGLRTPRAERFLRVRPGEAPDHDFVFDFDLDRLPGEIDRALAPLREETDFLFAGRLREQAEVAGLEREARDLARDARRAEGAERQRLEQELRDRLGEIFDRKMELRRERVDRLEQELHDTRSSYDTRAAARGDMIDRRLRELLGEDDALEW